VARAFPRCLLQTFRCPTETFERKVFWRCLHRRSLPLSWLLFRLKPAFFKHDLACIHQLGLTRSPAEFDAEVDWFIATVRQEHGDLASLLRLRLSGRRLLRLRKEIFGSANDPAHA
jgi:hypothetical protein